MQNSRVLPDLDRISVLAATVLLALILTRLVNFPERSLQLQLPGFYLEFQINIRTLISLLVSALTVTGADWLLRDNPRLGSRSTVPHWLLPAATAWALSATLFLIPGGIAWWAAFFSGGAILMLVMIGEYISIDQDNPYYFPAAMGLTALAFAVYFALVVSIYTAHLRLFLFLPILLTGAWLVSLRTLSLRLGDFWPIWESLTIVTVTAQLAAVFHYMPLSPINFGLLLLGPLYGLVNLISNISESSSRSRTMASLVIPILFTWGIAAFS